MADVTEEELLHLCGRLELLAERCVDEHTYDAGSFVARRLLLDAGAHVRGAAAQLAEAVPGE